MRRTAIVARRKRCAIGFSFVYLLPCSSFRPPLFLFFIFLFFSTMHGGGAEGCALGFFFLLKEKNKAGGWLAFTLSWAICRAALRKGDLVFFFLFFSSFAASFFSHFLPSYFFFTVFADIPGWRRGHQQLASCPERDSISRFVCIIHFSHGRVKKEDQYSQQ